MSIIVSKFGGTSNSTAEAVGQCVELGGDSQFLVTSAPGKLSSAQFDGMDVKPDVPEEFLASKVTDQLLAAHSSYIERGEIPSYMLDSITARYAAIVNGLGIYALKYEWLRDIAPRVTTAAQFGEDYASMLGERLQSEIYVALGRRLLDPIRSGEPLMPRQRHSWKSWLQRVVEPGVDYVVPGNTYGDGRRLYTYDRGGSDITGSFVAYGSSADVYRNMSDTPAQSVDPRLITDASRRRMIRHLTYQEGRELGRNGTGLLHPEAIIPLMGSGIPTEIRNTFDPSGPYTLYSDEVDNVRRTGRVMAISLMPDVSIVSVHEPGMSESKARIATLSGHVAAAGVSVIDIEGSGSDTELFIVEEKDLEVVRDSLAGHTNGQATIYTEDCSMVTLVGYELKRRAIDIRFGLALDAGLGKEYQGEGPHWMEGRHSLRFTVGRDRARQIVDDAHHLLIEQTPADYFTQI